MKRFLHSILLILCLAAPLDAHRMLAGVTDEYVYFVAVDSTDNKTRETGLSSFTVYYSINGGAATAMTTPTVNETDGTNMPGCYELLIDEAGMTTLAAGDDTSELCLHITQASMAPVTRVVEIYRAKATAGETITVSGGDISEVSTLTGHTAQTGDTYALANGANGFANIKSDTAATLADTGTDGVVVATNNDKTGYTASTVSDKTGYSLAADQSAVTVGTTTAVTNMVTANMTQLGGSATPVTNLNNVFNTDYATAFNEPNGVFNVRLVDVSDAAGIIREGTGSGQISLTNGQVTVGTNNDKTGYGLADDAITSAKFDESTAFPLKSADTGATAVARTGADSDTLETLSDEIDSTSTHDAAAVKTAMEADGSKLDHVWETTEDDAGVRRFTTNALEQAPTGGGTTQDIADAVRVEMEKAIDGDPNAGSLFERIKTLDDAYTATRGAYLDNIASKTGFSLASPQTFDLTGDITGNLSGSVGSVTGAVGSVTAGVDLADDAITSAKFDESTAFALGSADTGATAVARVGADSDTLETLSGQIDGASTHSAADVKTALEADGSKLDHVWETTEDDGGVRRFSENALEEAPSGTGGDATAANQTTIINHLTDIKGPTWSADTDQLEDLRDRGDAAWTTGSGTGLSPIGAGTAQAGTGQTITLAAGSTFATSTLMGQKISIHSGTGIGQTNYITGYDATSKVARCLNPWFVTPDATSVYEIVAGEGRVLDVLLGKR